MNFISDNDEGRVMDWKSDNKEILINDKADEVVEELFESLLNKYQNNLEKSIKDGDILFDYVDLLYYKCHKVNLCVKIGVNHIWFTLLDKKKQQEILRIKKINTCDTL